jgi:hypothetical protein
MLLFECRINNQVTNDKHSTGRRIWYEEMKKRHEKGKKTELSNKFNLLKAWCKESVRTAL